MARTRKRPLPSGRCSPEFAATFAGVAGGAGASALAVLDPVASALAVGNMALYAGAYTSLKPKSEINTWVGAARSGGPALDGWPPPAGPSTARVADPRRNFTTNGARGDAHGHPRSRGYWREPYISGSSRTFLPWPGSIGRIIQGVSSRWCPATTLQEYEQRISSCATASTPRSSPSPR